MITDEKLTLAQIRELTGYGTTATTYQQLRKHGVHPVSFRKNPVQGGDIGEYDAQQVLDAMSARIRKYRSDMARAEA